VTFRNDQEITYAHSTGFAEKPKISSLSVIPETPFYVHEIPPGYIDMQEALNAYHSSRMAYLEDGKMTSILQSMADLRYVLKKGKIPSFHVGPRQKVRTLDKKDWAKDGPITREMYHEKFIYNTFDDDLEKRTVVANNIWTPFISIINEKGEKIRGHVVILIDDLISIINNGVETDGFVDTATANDDAVPRGGRPPIHDGEAFLIEAFKIVYTGPEPRTLDDLVSATARAYKLIRGPEQGFKKAPGETWMKERLRPLYRWLSEGHKDR
jgi:hypothetical protein